MKLTSQKVTQDPLTRPVLGVLCLTVGVIFVLVVYFS